MFALADVPILLGCHHQDLASGVGRFEEIAAAVNRLGEVGWTSLGRLAEGNWYRRVAGRTMELRLLTRTASVVLPSGVDEMLVEVPSGDAEHGFEVLTAAGPRGGAEATSEQPGSWRVGVEAGTWEIRLARSTAAAEVRPAQVSARALLRRAACEVRDRLAPIRFHSTKASRS